MDCFIYLKTEDARLLSVLYGQSHRKYHNRPHPNYVFDYCMEIWAKHKGHKNGDPSRFLSYVCAYHDAIYVVGAKDNELKSAELWLNSATAASLNDIVLMNKGYEWIKASANHFDPANETLDVQARIFLDADLYELGSDWELFNHNSNNVLKEFMSVYTEEDVLKGRLKWLRETLAQPHIYWITTEREAKARENLQRSIEVTQHSLERLLDLPY